MNGWLDINDPMEDRSVKTYRCRGPRNILHSEWLSITDDHKLFFHADLHPFRTSISWPSICWKLFSDRELFDIRENKLRTTMLPFVKWKFIIAIKQCCIRRKGKKGNNKFARSYIINTRWNLELGNSSSYELLIVQSSTTTLFLNHPLLYRRP